MILRPYGIRHNMNVNRSFMTAIRQYGIMSLLGCNVISGRSRIFPRGVRQIPKILLFFNFWPKSAWQWKNLDPRGGGVRPWRPTLGSANGNHYGITALRHINLMFEVISYDIYYEGCTAWRHNGLAGFSIGSRRVAVSPYRRIQLFNYSCRIAVLPNS